jgi:peptidyl-prolyl cis-trans isomerase SurA
MSKFLRRKAILTAAALPLAIVPWMMSGAAVTAFAQSRPLIEPPSRVATPKVQLPADIGAPVAAPQAAAAPSSQINEGVAAIVNDDIISTYDMRQRMRLLVVTSGVQPTEQSLPQLEQEALRSLIDEHLQTQELKRFGKKQKVELLADDKDVDAEISDMAKQNNLNYSQMKASFATAGVDIQTLREQIRTQISWQRLISGLYGSQVRVGDDQVSNTLQRLSTQASQTQYLTAEIFIEANRVGGMQQAMAGASQLVAQLQQGAPFAGVARQFSAASTAANGGDTGWLTAAQAQPEVAKALEQMRPGQLSAPIPVNDGVYIVMLRDKKAASGQTMVALKQAAVRLDKNASPEQVNAANAALRAVRPQIKGCENIEAVAGRTPGMISADLGEAELNDLRGPFKDAAIKLGPGEVSDPIRTDVGLHLVAVCTKRTGGSQMPSRTDVSDRLYAEKLSVMSKRYLRDLRNSATIEER